MIENRNENFKLHFLGTHFFNPPRYLELLEIIPTNFTGQHVTNFMMKFGKDVIGKDTILCKDSPAFIANRIGVASILVLFKLISKYNFSIKFIDILTGNLIGRPKSATFRTCDVVGIDVLNHLVDDQVKLAIDNSFSGFFEKIKGVEFLSVNGPHPAGNVSVHIHKHNPINMGEKVWEVRPEDVANIGMLFSSGEFNAKRTVAVAGESVLQPQYLKTTIGAELSSLTDVSGYVDTVQNRFINGDVLSGTAESSDGHLDYFNNLLSIIPEGDQYRMFGWLPFIDNAIPSLSKTSLSWLFNKKGYSVNTNMNGEERAFVVTGEMEKVFPMNIFPMQLLKACMAGDIEKMEALGIYEVIPEDFGLIDYANTSKIEAQEIIKEGIELMIKEVG